MAVNINGDTGIDKVQPGSVDGVDLTDGSVTEGKIGTGSVTADKIGAGAVTSAKLDTNISVPGTVTATSFVGSGASLTGIAGGFSNLEAFTSPGTWTNPGNITKVKVTVVGGGGSSQAVPASPAESRATPGAGGGGGAIEVIPFPSGTNVAVTVGGASGTSSFGGYCSATGGTAGTPYNTLRTSGRKAGGSGSGGTLNFAGGSGGMSIAGSSVTANRANAAVAGGGGGSLMGSAQPSSGSTGQGDYPNNPVWGSPGIPGASYGGGASGAHAGKGPGTYPGGTGSPGVVIVEY